MKISRRIILWIVIAIIVLPGFVAIALMPGSIEGVYNPLSISSTAGCDCDQFEEFREGRVISHVMDSHDAMMLVYYEQDKSGSISVRLSPDKPGEKGELLARAEPHLLGTRFYYPDSGKSEWAWKRIVTWKIKAHMAGVKIRGLVPQDNGVSFNIYDSKFNVLNSTFRPKRAANPVPAP